jgi:flagellar motor protein MotB
MAKPCKGCKKSAECEECPEWIFTFADLVMLMMGFFVILWVLKPNPGKNGAGDAEAAQSQERYEVMVGEVRKGFGWMPDPSSPDPIDKRMIERMNNKMNGPGEKGRAQTESKGADGTDNEVMPIRQGKQSVVGGRLLFESGDAKITTEMGQQLDQIVLQIRGHRNIVMVKGHASLDDFGDGGTSEQKMDLSIRRAQAVADYLMARGVEPDILREQGCSTFEPVIQREYEPNIQSLNRRVEVEATSSLVVDRQDQHRPNGATTTKTATTAPLRIEH